MLGWTALMLAAVNGRYDMCKVLLQKGADPNLGDEYSNSSRTAKEKGLHPIDGEKQLTYCRPQIANNVC